MYLNVRTMYVHIFNPILFLSAVNRKLLICLDSLRKYIKKFLLPCQVKVRRKYARILIDFFCLARCLLFIYNEARGVDWRIYNLSQAKPTWKAATTLRMRNMRSKRQKKQQLLPIQWTRLGHCCCYVIVEQLLLLASCCCSCSLVVVAAVLCHISSFALRLINALAAAAATRCMPRRQTSQSFLILCSPFGVHLWPLTHTVSVSFSLLVAN